MKFVSSLILFVGLTGASAWGQVSLTAIGSPYTENFDGLAASGTNNKWTDDSTIIGWYSNRTAYIGDAGTNTTGGIHSYGVAGMNPVTDRGLGALSSGSASPVFAVRLVNNTGTTIDKFVISYTGEQWRQTANTQSLTFEYQVGATSDSTGSWTALSALSFTAPKTGTAGALDGNATGNFTAISSTIIANVASGQEIWLRWSKTGTSSPGLAIDDISVTPKTMTSTNFYSKSTGDLAALSTWGPDADGSGTPPLDFITDYHVFNIVNNATPIISSAWTVSGSGSKIVLGDGTNAVSFTIPSGSAVTGTIDVLSHATLVMENVALPTFGTIDNNSTLDFAQSGTFVIPSTPTTYGNLTLTGGTKTFSSGTYTIPGNLVVDNVSGFTGAASPFTTVNLAGNLVLQNGAAFNSDPANGFTLVCNGSSAQTLQGNGSDLTLFRITVSNTHGVSLSTSGGSTNVFAGNASGGGIETTSGCLMTNSNTVTLYTSATSQLLSEASGHYVVGTVKMTKTAVGTVATSTYFNTIGASIAAGADDIGDVSVTRVTGTAGIVSNPSMPSEEGIARKWTITSTNPPSSGRNLTLSWISDDDNGKTATELQNMEVYQSTNGGSSWIAVGTSQDASSSRWVTVNTASFSQWTVSDLPDNPLPVTMKGISAKVDGGKIYLSISTATEIDIAGFNISRSLSNDGPFELISGYKSNPALKASGSTTGGASYSFVDAKVSAGKTYYYKVESVSTSGVSEQAGDILKVQIAIPKDYAVYQNYPNPFNPTTNIRFDLKADARVTLEIYNVLGMKVRSLNDGTMSAGTHEISVDMSRMASGVYYYRFTATEKKGESFVQTQRMMLMK